MRCVDSQGCPLAPTCAHAAIDAKGRATLLNGQRQALGICVHYEPITLASAIERATMRATVAVICRRNPNGLQVKPFFAAPAITCPA